MMFKKLCPSKKKMTSSSADRKQIAPPPPVVSRNGSVSTTDESDSASGDSLEGLMQLTVNLPDKRIVSMSVEKRMPMMDLLIHVTTANKISPGGHIIKIVNDEENGFLSYKPSTPIGSLTSSVIFIVPKKNLNEQPSKRELAKSTQPFEPTFRLQVHLPRQQLLVLRVSQQTKLSNIHQMVCSQKGLDSSRYYLQHPTNPDIILDYNLCLADYSLNEINMASRYSQSNNTLLANESFIIPKEAEDKKRKTLFGMFRRAKPHSSDLKSTDKSSRNSTLTDFEESIKASSSRPLNVSQTKATKKRPAPPPPVIKSNGRERPPPPPPLHSKSSTSVELVHSRQSSDSSGYHDSSVLGDSPEGLAAETSVNSETEHLKCNSTKYLTMPVSPIHTDVSKSKVSTNLTTVLSTSNSSITTGLKKRRAPLPPSQSTSPTCNRCIENTDESVITNINSEPSLLPYPKGNNPADPSPPSSPSLSKEIPDTCMKVQYGPEKAEYPPECAVNMSVVVRSHVETIDLPGDGDSPSSNASPDDRSDDACLPSRFGPEDTELSQSSSVVDTKVLHDLHDNHPSSLPCVVADVVVTHKVDSRAATAPSKTNNPLSSIANFTSSTLHSPSKELNASASNSLLENSEISLQNVTHDKISFDEAEKSERKPDVGNKGPTSAENEVEEKDRAEFTCIDKENGEINVLEADDTEKEPFRIINDAKVNDLEERTSLCSLSSDDEDDVMSAFQEVITDAKKDLIKNSNLSVAENKVIDLHRTECTTSLEKNETDKSQKFHSIPTSVEGRVNKSTECNVNIRDKNVVSRSLSSSSQIETKPKLKVSESFQELSSANERQQGKVHYRRPLMNFSISTYKPRSDVTTLHERNLVKSESFSTNLNETHADRDLGKPRATRSSSFEGKFSDQLNPFQVPETPRNTILNVVNAEVGKKANGRSSQLRIGDDSANVNEMNGFPSTKAASMVDLSQDEEAKLRRTKSEFVVSPPHDHTAGMDQPEYLQLQHEYLKLQNKLLYWQQQLLSNQNLLQRQHILPSDVFHLSPEMLSLPRIESDTGDYSTPAAKASTFPKQSDKGKNDHQTYADLPRIGSFNQDLNQRVVKNNRPLSMDITKVQYDDYSNRDVGWSFDGQNDFTSKPHSKKSAKDTSYNGVESNQRSSDICSIQNSEYAKETVLSSDESKQIPNCKILENKVVLKKPGEGSAGDSDSLPSVKERIKFMEQCYVKDGNNGESELNGIESDLGGSVSEIHLRKDSLTSSSRNVGNKSSLNNLPTPMYKSVSDYNLNGNKQDKKLNHEQSARRKFRRQRVDVDDESGDKSGDGFSKGLPFVVGVWESDKVNNSEPVDFISNTKAQSQKTPTEFVYNNKKNVSENSSRQTTILFKEPFAVSNKKIASEVKKAQSSPNVGEASTKLVPEDAAAKRHTSSVKINGVQGNKTNAVGSVTIHIKDSSLPRQTSSVQQRSYEGNGIIPRAAGKNSEKRIVPQQDPRDALLQAIQNFGGVKSLKRVPKEESRTKRFA